MTDPVNWGQIAHHCGKLPDDKLAELLRLIDLLPAGERPTAVLEVIRPRLGRMRAVRRVTLQRLAFLPVEDLFDPPEVYGRDIGRLSRHCVPPCWTVIRQDADPAMLDEVANALAEAPQTDAPLVQELGGRLWPAAARALRRALLGYGAAGQGALSLVDADEDIRRQAATVASVLEIGSDLLQARSVLPNKPIEGLAGYHVEYLKTVVGRLGGIRGERSKTFLLVLAARMVRPGQLLDLLPTTPATAEDRTERDRVLLDITSGMVDRLVAETRKLVRATAPLPEPRHASAEARRLLQGFESLAATLDARLGGLAAINPAVIAVREARRAICAYLGDAVVAPAGKTLLSLLSGAPDTRDTRADAAYRQEQVEALALALRDCVQTTESLEGGATIGAQVSAICAEVHTRTRNAALPEVAAARLIEILAGPDMAERLLLGD